VYRTGLDRLLMGTVVERTPHEAIIRDLDRAGSLVHVLVLKTNLTLPYTSVFLRLECGYWTPQAEARLRTALVKQQVNAGAPCTEVKSEK
jgi:hypothetical protein